MIMAQPQCSLSTILQPFCMCSADIVDNVGYGFWYSIPSSLQEVRICMSGYGKMLPRTNSHYLRKSNLSVPMFVLTKNKLQIVVTFTGS